jgi:hypothetical protein
MEIMGCRTWNKLFASEPIIYGSPKAAETATPMHTGSRLNVRY